MNNNTIIEIIKKYITLLIIFSTFGICIGMYVNKQIYNSKMDDAIKLQGLIYKGVVYEIKVKP